MVNTLCNPEPALSQLQLVQAQKEEMQEDLPGYYDLLAEVNHHKQAQKANLIRSYWYEVKAKYLLYNHYIENP